MDPNQDQHQPQANSGPSPPDPNDNKKRQALTGQWRTPPLPVFAAQQQVQPPPQQTHHPVMPPAASLPESSDDYAKALHEAFRRGAQAAEALQIQRQQHSSQTHHPAPTPEFPPLELNASMSNAVSCPNFQQMQPPHLGAMAQVPLMSEEPLPEPAPVLVPNPLMSVALPQAPPAQAPFVQISAPPSMQPPQHEQQQAQEAASQPRSFSLPDMASYAARAQDEEEKRKKRLARNRASARLRRLRKKNLVDSYEGEVGVLEQSLQKLRAHNWGEANPEDDPTSALLDALGMERGQQVLEDSTHRSVLLNDLWKQQQDQVKYVRDSQLEQQMLQALVSGECDDSGLVQELHEVLQLTPDQRASLQSATQGLDEDVHAMEIVDACLKAMQDQDWLLQNEGVTQITDQFNSILNPNQVSKFLLWTDANSEATEQLDYVHASDGPVANTPIFSFGMDDYYPNTANVNAGSSGSLTAMMQTGEDE